MTLMTEEVAMPSEHKTYEDGVKETAKLVFNHLQDEYMSRRVKRGTPYSEEILELTRTLGIKMRALSE